MSQLSGKRVVLMISDPWDFGTACGVGPFAGTLTDFGTVRIAEQNIQRAVVTLDRPINYSSTNYFSAICQVRHEGASLDGLEAGGFRVSINITLLPKQAKTFSNISDEDFRSGFAATGSLQLV